MTGARLRFECAQGRTRLASQYVPYPFHVTRPFYLDQARPDFATLYLQSSSGGLYSGEQLRLDIRTGSDAAVEITTQAATLVRDSKGKAAAIENHLNLGRGSLTMHTPDPLVLFPNARVRSNLSVTLEPGARAVCQEAFCLSSVDPQQPIPGHYGFTFSVRDETGKLLVSERGEVDLATIGTAVSPLGPYRAAGAVYLIGAMTDTETINQLTAVPGCVTGVSLLPNGAGTAIRILADGGGALANGMKMARAICFSTAAGFTPAPRRK